MRQKLANDKNGTVYKVTSDGKRHLLAENVSVWITLGSSPNTAVNIDVIELFLAGQY